MQVFDVYPGSAAVATVKVNKVSYARLFILHLTVGMVIVPPSIQ